MKSVLVTGASGFVGSTVVEACIENNLKTFAAIRKSSNPRYLKDERINIVYLNLNDKEELKTQLQELINKEGLIHYIIHVAGITKAKKLSDFWEHNYNTTINLVDAILELNIPIEKFVQVSSLAAFGPGDAKTLLPRSLNDAPLPNTTYGKSKLKAEEYVRSKDNLPWLIFRPTGIYGPKDVDYFVYFKTINRKFEPYIGCKEQYLTFIYSKDLANLIVSSLSTPIVKKSYFVSDGDVYTSKEFANITKNILKVKTFRLVVPKFIVKIIAYTLDFLYKPFGRAPLLNVDKYNILTSINWKCEVEPLFKDFNFKPQYNLEKGITETIKWYKENGWLK